MLNVIAATGLVRLLATLHRVPIARGMVLTLWVAVAITAVVVFLSGHLVTEYFFNAVRK